MSCKLSNEELKQEIENLKKLLPYRKNYYEVRELLYFYESELKKRCDKWKLFHFSNCF